MSNKLRKRIKKQNKIELDLLHSKKILYIKLGCFVSIILIFLWLLYYVYLNIQYHNELGSKVIRCNNFTTLNVDSNGVFTWNFDNRPNEKLNGVLQIYFGDNAIDFIVENETYYNLGRDYIETFFDDVDYKKENFFALKIKGFYYDSLESETGLLDSNITKYYYGFELDDNRLQAICPETIEMMVFEYVD